MVQNMLIDGAYGASSHTTNDEFDLIGLIKCVEQHFNFEEKNQLKFFENAI